MFKKAIKLNLNYTRPVLIGERFFNKPIIEMGIGAFIILNRDGFVLTCKHIAERIQLADQLNQKYMEYLKEIKNKSKKEIEKINIKYDYNDFTLIQTINIFMNCFEDGRLEKIIYHKNLDLALIKWKDFSKVCTEKFPQISTKKIEPGESICRLGFPWPTFNCFDIIQDDIKVKKNGDFNTPAFPLDGMVTRLFNDDSGKIIAFETSTPGLRGQSGGPIFDVEGNIIGLQSATSHLDLMFDIDFDVVRNHKNVHASEKQFINLGIGVSANQIIKFLDDNKVEYNKV